MRLLLALISDPACMCWLHVSLLCWTGCRQGCPAAFLEGFLARSHSLVSARPLLSLRWHSLAPEQRHTVMTHSGNLECCKTTDSLASILLTSLQANFDVQLLLCCTGSGRDWGQHQSAVSHVPAQGQGPLSSGQPGSGRHLAQSCPQG